MSIQPLVRRCSGIALAICCTFGFRPNQGRADVVAVALHFEGHITVVQDRFGLLGGSITVGMPLSGQYMFDVAAADADPTIPDEANYPNALIHFSLQIGDITLEGGGGENEIQVRNRDSDTYLVRDRSLVLLGQSVHATILLQDLDGRVFLDDRLPLAPPNLEEFEIHEFSVITPAAGPAVSVIGEIGSIAMASEPCTPACATAGCSGGCPSPDPCTTMCCLCQSDCNKGLRETCSCVEIVTDACCQNPCGSGCAGECSPECSPSGDPDCDQNCGGGSGDPCCGAPCCPNCCKGCCQGDCCDSNDPCCGAPPCCPNCCPGPCCGSPDPCCGVDCTGPCETCVNGACVTCPNCCGGTCCDPAAPCCSSPVRAEFCCSEDQTCCADSCCDDGLTCTVKADDPDIHACCDPADGESPCDGTCCDMCHECEYDPLLEAFVCVPICPECSLCDTSTRSRVCLPDPAAECFDCTSGKCDDAGNCNALECGLARGDAEPLRACPGGSVVIDVHVTCAPDCPDVGPVSLGYEFDPDGGESWSGWPPSAECPHDPATFTLIKMVIDVGADAEPRQQPYDVVARGALEGTQCDLPLPIQVVGPEIDFAGVSDAQEEEPGGFLGLNSDDDNANCIPDLEETGMPDDDLKPVELEVIGASLLGAVRLVLSGGVLRVRIWEDAGRTILVYSPGSGLTEITWPAGDFPNTLYVEGVLPTGQGLGTYLTLWYDDPAGWSCDDRVRLRVFGVDLDVDSNNDGAIDLNNTSDGSDDKIEDKPLYPTPSCAPNFAGKWVWPNNDDSNNNGMSDNQAGTVEGQPVDDTLHIDGPIELTSGDIAQLQVQPIQPAPRPGWTLYLELADPDRVRVFGQYADGAFAFMGPGMLSKTPIPKAVGGWTFGFEGVSPGTTMLALILEDESGQEVARDEVRVTVVGLEVTWEDSAGNPITDENLYSLSDDLSETAPPLEDVLGVKYYPDATIEGGILERHRTSPRSDDPACGRRDCPSQGV